MHKYFNDNKEKINKYFDNVKGKQFYEYTIPKDKAKKEMPEDVVSEFEYLKKNST